MARLENERFDVCTNGYKNTKIAKSQKSGKGVFTIILHLAPGNNSGYEVCSHASAGCRAGCLYTAGRGGCDRTKTARIKRTRRYYEHPEHFRAQLVADIHKLVYLCEENRLQPAVRLNGTSDIPWETEFPELFTMFPHVQFYDYTKNPDRLTLAHDLPNNYHLTFSRSEDNQALSLQILESGRANVAVVFQGELPEFWNGYPVYDAEQDDLRFLDPIQGGAVAGLAVKGKARRDVSGFVVRAEALATV